MSDLFTREGVAFTGTPRIDDKGKPFTGRPVTCFRCGGAGRSDRWCFTGFVCYQCNGVGTLPGEVTVRLYTAEQLTKLNVARDKVRARKAAAEAVQAEKRATEIAERAAAFRAERGDLVRRAWDYLFARYGADEFTDDLMPAGTSDFVHDIISKAERSNAMSDAQAAAVEAALERYAAEQARKAAAKHVGREGERLTIEVKVERVVQIERAAFNAPWRTEIVCISTLRDATGNTFVVKSPRFYVEEGSSVKIKGTVKRHTEYRGEAQTELSRVAVL